jgi:hypothetical protein
MRKEEAVVIVQSQQKSSIRELGPSCHGSVRFAPDTSATCLCHSLNSGVG